MGLTRWLAALGLLGRRDARQRPMRLHFYISHSFDHAHKYLRLLEFMKSERLDTADYSVPVGSGSLHEPAHEERGSRVM